MEKRGIFTKSGMQFIGWNVLAAVLVALVVLAGLLIWLRSYTQHGVEVAVDDVRGMVVAEAEPVLSANGLRLVVVDSTYSDKVPLGTIVEQDPAPWSHAKHGRAVYVTINATTKRQIVMPNLQDMSYRQAQTTLRGLGLQVDSVYEYEPSAFRDLELDVKSDNSSIRPGDKVAIGTKVRLVVGFGKGTELVAVPNVVGLTLQDARSQLLRHRLTVGAVTYDEPKEKETVRYVYLQTPAAGERLLEGETVALCLSEDIEKAAKMPMETDNEEWF